MLERLELENFRTYAKRSFDLAPLTVLIGPNGIGKTNVLEAVSMLSLTTSWRTETDSEVVAWGEPFCRVTGDMQELVVQSHPYMKRLRHDGISKRTYQVIGMLPSVLFQPDDIQIIYGSPNSRRQYLDRILSQTSTAYTRAILELAKILKQRNRLLKMIQENTASPEELLFWDGELERLHAVISPEREQLIGFFNQRLPETFAQMIPDSPAILMEYMRSPRQAEHFLNHLHQQRHKEVMAGTSLYGPHREDVRLMWGEHAVAESMSRGQARALLIAMKIAELEYISARNEVRPILLLDDIFSELDQERRERLVSILGDYQVIMTTTELGNIESILSKEARVVDLTNLV